MGKYKTKTIQADLGTFTHIPVYSDISRHVQADILRHIQAYSESCATLTCANPQQIQNQRHIKSRGIFRTLAYPEQGRRDGTSIVTFELLIMNCEIDFINLFIFNYLASNINLLVFNCLALNINLFIFNCLTSSSCILKNLSFTSRRERLFMDARPQFRILSSPGKMMTCYL